MEFNYWSRMSKWFEIQVLRADGSVLLIEGYDFEDVKNGRCQEWDPSRDVCAWHIKFKEEDEEHHVLANYVCDEVVGNNFENLRHVYENHVIKSAL